MARPDLNLVLHLALPDAGRLRREVCDLPVANVGTRCRHLCPNRRQGQSRRLKKQKN
jgi:hypothetical protein